MNLAIASSGIYGMRGSNPDGDYFPGAAPDAPSDLVVTALSDTRMGISYTDNCTNETGFEIERSPNESTGWALIQLNGINGVSHIDDGLTASTQYYDRVRAINGAGSSAYTTVESDTTLAAGALLATILAQYNFLPQDAEGYSILTPSADSRLIYVDDTDGDDGTATNYLMSTIPNVNDWEDPGAVNAYQDPAVAILQMRQGYPDYLLLKRGGVWATSNYLRQYSGRNVNERSVITAYGTGNRPHLNATGNHETIRLWNFADYCVVKGVQVMPTFRIPTHIDFAGWGLANGGIGIRIWTSSTQPVKKGVLIEDCDISYCTTNLSCSSDVATGHKAEDIILRRNIIENAWSEEEHAQGLSGYHTKMLIEENLLHHNGWYQQSYDGSSTSKVQGQANIHNHNLYIGGAPHYLLRGNITSKPSSLGFKFSSNPPSPTNLVTVSDGILDDNLIIDAELGISMGGNSDYENGPRWDNIHITNNVLTKLGETKPTNRDLAWGIEADDWQSGLISGNLLHAFGSDSELNILPIFLKGYCTNVTVDANISWDVGIDTGSNNNPIGVRLNDAGDTIGTMNGVVISNNYFQTSKEQWVMENEDSATGVTFTDNKYYSGRDTNEWFSQAGSSYSYAAWQALSNVTDTGATLTQTTWFDDSRTIESYMTSLGQTATHDEFINKAREMMEPGSWDADYTASAFNFYMFTGFTPV